MDPYLLDYSTYGENPHPVQTRQNLRPALFVGERGVGFHDFWHGVVATGSFHTSVGKRWSNSAVSSPARLGTRKGTRMEA